LTRERLPIGLQFTGRPMEDVTVLRVGDVYQRVTSWSQLPPSPALPPSR
jgi:Asp-tRNA(Asn)/Glu-tRNA(Gln) amidotransferase A subunit family amidase